MLRKLVLTVLALIMIPSEARTQPELSIPLNGSFVETTTPALLWEKLEDANVYVVSIFADRKGTRRIAKLTIRGNSCMVAEGRLRRGETYWWNVAPSRGGILDEPSSMWSFTVLREKVPDHELPAEDNRPRVPGTETGKKPEKTSNRTPRAASSVSRRGAAPGGGRHDKRQGRAAAHSVQLSTVPE